MWPGLGTSNDCFKILPPNPLEFTFSDRWLAPQLACPLRIFLCMAFAILSGSRRTHRRNRPHGVDHARGIGHQLERSTQESCQRMPELPASHCRRTCLAQSLPSQICGCRRHPALCPGYPTGNLGLRPVPESIPVQASPCNPLWPRARIPTPGQVLCHRPNVQRVCKDIRHTQKAHRAPPGCHGVPTNPAGLLPTIVGWAGGGLRYHWSWNHPHTASAGMGGCQSPGTSAQNIWTLLPPAGSQDAAYMHLKWSQRNPIAGSGFEQLQGHALTKHEAPEPRVVLFDDDLPAFVYQSPPGMNPGDGRFSLHGLAKETARLHIRTQVFVHFFSGYRRRGDLHDLLEHHIFPKVTSCLCSQWTCAYRGKGEI